MSSGAIAGIVVGGIVVLAITALLCYCLLKQSRSTPQGRYKIFRKRQNSRLSVETKPPTSSDNEMTRVTKSPIYDSGPSRIKGQASGAVYADVAPIDKNTAAALTSTNPSYQVTGTSKR